MIKSCIIKPLNKLKLANCLRDICGYLGGTEGCECSHQKNLMLFLLLLMLIQPAQAKAYTGINDALVCQDAAIKFEDKYQIKEHLLTTITSVETGRWNEEKKQTLGWPWTINAQGKGQFFDNKADAIKAIKQLQARGVKSIDVGCMQINLKYHGKQFKNVEDALDPYKNVEYGAKYLKKLYVAKNNDWLKAAMAYHSNVLNRALKYKKKLVIAYAKVKEQNNEISLADNGFNKITITANANKFYAKQTAEKVNSPKEQALAWRKQKLAEYRENKIK